MRANIDMRSGYTLVETVVSVAVFVVIALAIYQGYTTLLKASRLSDFSSTATALANEQFEIIRNTPYDEIGIQNGIPVGVLPRTQTLVRNGTTFRATTTIRNVDDPFDGTIGGSPSDLSPADYKLVAIDLSCATCVDTKEYSFTTYVAPKALETLSTNGALFIRVFDANGAPVEGASVHIENNLVSPAVSIDDTTSSDGYYQLVDAPPGVSAYEITVTKGGYSTERSYMPGDGANPNPTKPHPTVIVGSVTQTSFSIDRTSDIAVSSVTNQCASVGNIDFDMQGAKMIGTSPDVMKYTDSHTTNGGGALSLNALEWDTYALTLTDGAYDLIGSIPLVPLALTPGSQQDLSLIVAPKNPNTLLVTVTDAGTQLPLTDATVRLEGTSFDETAETGRGYLAQTEWNGGSGQSDIGATDKYMSSTHIMTSVGEFSLAQSAGTYESSGVLESSTFDTGTTSDFHNIGWLPLDQQVGIDDVNDIRFQFATNNDNATWNFIGPDGTSGSYYTINDTNLSAAHSGARYARYRAYLSTSSATTSPLVTDVSFTYTTSCIPPGQVAFTGLLPGTYTLTVTRTGYQPVTRSVNISSSWVEEKVVLSP